MDALTLTDAPEPPKLNPFRRAVVRGLAVLLPPLLTIVIFLWVGNTVTRYLLEPLESFARRIVVRQYQSYIVPANQIELTQENEATGRTDYNFQIYQQLADGRFVLADHYDYLRDDAQMEAIPGNANEFYRLYVEQRFFQPYVVIPLFLCLFILVLYLLGKFLAAGVGRFFWIQFERVIHRLPVIRNVYSSVKQVTDFLFSEREVDYTRVVAVEYPRKGIWSLAMVTGESLLDIRSAANEPVLSVLVPTSPMPFTGFTVTVLKSETLDLNITIDQAFQFIVSCGVVVPPHQLAQALAEKEKALGTSPGLLPTEGDRISPTR